MIEFYRQTKPTQTTVFMSNHTFLSSFWEGFHIVKPHHTTALIKLTLKPNSIAKCPCGLKAQAVHEYQWSNVKEATLLGTPVELSVQTRRIKCSHCGIKTERLSFKYATGRLPHRNIEYESGLDDNLLTRCTIKGTVAL